MGGPLFAICLVFVAPILISRFVLRGGWAAVGLAYAVWFGFLALQVLIGAPAGRLSEAAGWMIILAMYLTIPVVCGMVLIVNIGFGLKAFMQRRMGA